MLGPGAVTSTFSAPPYQLTCPRLGPGHFRLYPLERYLEIDLTVADSATLLLGEYLVLSGRIRIKPHPSTVHDFCIAAASEREKPQPDSGPYRRGFLKLRPGNSSTTCCLW